MFASALERRHRRRSGHMPPRWSSPIGGATAFPLAISDCQYDLSGAEVTGDIQLIKYKPGSGTCTSTSGHVIPGGFGWLDHTGGPCLAATDADDTVPTDTGANYPGACDANRHGAGRTRSRPAATVEGTFPVYDDAGGTGQAAGSTSGATPLSGSSAGRFRAADRPRSSGHDALRSGAAANDCTGSCRGIIGQFVKFESIDSAGGTGGDRSGSRIC